ncbi:hypothetical protein BDV3_001653 [Batrachochytrium dendrobatidis]
MTTTATARGSTSMLTDTTMSAPTYMAANGPLMLNHPTMQNVQTDQQRRHSLQQLQLQFHQQLMNSSVSHPSLQQSAATGTTTVSTTTVPEFRSFNRKPSMELSPLDFPTGTSPSPLPTIEQTPNRFLASLSKLDLEVNPFEASLQNSAISSSIDLPDSQIASQQLHPHAGSTNIDPHLAHLKLEHGHSYINGSTGFPFNSTLSATTPASTHTARFSPLEIRRLSSPVLRTIAEVKEHASTAQQPPAHGACVSNFSYEAPTLRDDMQVSLGGRRASFPARQVPQLSSQHLSGQQLGSHYQQNTLSGQSLQHMHSKSMQHFPQNQYSQHLSDLQIQAVSSPTNVDASARPVKRQRQLSNGSQLSLVPNSNMASNGNHCMDISLGAGSISTAMPISWPSSATSSPQNTPHHILTSFAPNTDKNAHMRSASQDVYEAPTTVRRSSEISSFDGSEYDTTLVDANPDHQSSEQSVEEANPDKKRRNFLERNRRAALKCRQKKKEYIASLEDSVVRLSSENERLHAQIQKMNQMSQMPAIMPAYKDAIIPANLQL